MFVYNKDIETLYKELNSEENGLSDEEAKKNLEKYGMNILDEGKKKSWFLKFISQFNDLMIIILIIVAIFLVIYGYFYSHEYTDAIVIFAVVLINAVMGFIQEQKAEVTLNDLK